MSLITITKADWKRAAWTVGALGVVEGVGALATLTPWWLDHLFVAAAGVLVAYFLEEKFAELK